MGEGLRRGVIIAIALRRSLRQAGRAWYASEQITGRVQSVVATLLQVRHGTQTAAIGLAEQVDSPGTTGSARREDLSSGQCDGAFLLDAARERISRVGEVVPWPACHHHIYRNRPSRCRTLPTSRRRLLFWRSGDTSYCLPARASTVDDLPHRRNAGATRSGGLDYRQATTAQWHADRSAKRPKPV